MVFSQAPNPRRPKNSDSPQWTTRFHPASALRAGQFTLWALCCGVLLLPASLSKQSEAQSAIPHSRPLGTADQSSAPISSTIPVTGNSLASAPTTSNAPTDLVGVASVVADPASSTIASSTNAPVSPITSTNTLSSTPSPLSPSQSTSTPNSQPVSSGAGANAARLNSARAPMNAVRPTISVQATIGNQVRRAQLVVTPKMTVGQALAAMGISLAALDRVTPDASALARNGLNVRVTRIQNQLKKRRVAIAAEVRYQPTTTIRAGAKQVIQNPRAGALEITERVWTRDGKVTQRKFVSQRLALAPQHKIIGLGVNSHLMPQAIRPHRRYLAARGGSFRNRLKPPSLAPANPNSFRAVRKVKVVATGYSAGPAGGAIGNWTATGVRCTYGAVAVDPRFIPLGSKLYIEGYGYGFACDTGGAIKGPRVDLAFNSPRAAFAHGRRRMTVWILES